PQRRACRGAGTLPPGFRRRGLDLRGRRRPAALRPGLPGGQPGRLTQESTSPLAGEGLGLKMPILGTNMPEMGTKANNRVSEAAAAYARANLSDALFTQTQQRVLAHLFGQPGRRYGVSELIQLTGAGSGAVQRELA